MTYKFYYCLLLLCSLLVGCSEEQESVASYVAKVKQTKPGDIEPLPANKEYVAEEYRAQSYRSPFVSGSGRSTASSSLTPDMQDTIMTDVPRPDANRPREYLERYSLSNFSMVGTLSKHEQYWGLVQDVNGKVHAVKIGDYIGENSGQITNITSDSIMLNEIVPDGTGGWMHKDNVLNLRIPTNTEDTTNPDVSTNMPTEEATSADE